MSAPTKPATAEEQLQILQEKVKNAPNGDSLIIKLYRRRGGVLGNAGIPDVLATLTDARLVHVASPELWVPRLAGGGAFLLTVYGSDDPVRPLIANFPFVVEGQPRDVDLDAVVDPGWRGPGQLMWPERRAGQTQQAAYSVNLAPPGSTPSMAAPQTQPTSGHGAPGVHFPPQPQPAVDQRIAEWMAQKERELAEAKAAMELERQRFALESQRERDRIAAEQRFAQLEARLAAQAEAARVAAAAPPAPVPPKESLADLVKALAPLAQQMLASQQEMRLETMKLSVAQQAETRELMKAVLVRPAIDPTMLALIERRDANEQPAGAILAQTTAAMTGMMENTMAMARFVAESSGAPAESPMLAAFREVAGAVEKIATASMQAPKPKPRRQAPPAQGPAPQAEAASAAVVPAQGAPPAPAGAASNVVPFQRPSEAVVDGTAQVQHLAGVDALEEGLLDRLEQMIRAHEEPSKVAAYLVSIFNSDEFQDALEEAGGSIVTIFQARLGTWALDPANPPYLTALLDQIQEKGAVAGIFQDEGEEDDDQEAEG